MVALASLCLCKSRAEGVGTDPAPKGGSGMGGQALWSRCKDGAGHIAASSPGWQQRLP